MLSPDRARAGAIAHVVPKSTQQQYAEAAMERKPNLIREYVAAVKSAAAKNPQEAPSELHTWVTFALETADHLDP